MIQSTVRPLRARLARFRRIQLLLVGASVAALSACASKTGGALRTNEVSETHSSRYVLVQADLEKSKADNVYDAIAKLRPEFLRGHADVTSFVKQDAVDKRDPTASAALPPGSGGAVSAGSPPVKVYRDNARLSGVDDLRQMPIAGIAEVRYIAGPEAGVKYGTDHSGGVILIKSK